MADTATQPITAAPASRRISLAELLLLVALCGLVLAIVAAIRNSFVGPTTIYALAMSADGSAAAALLDDGTARVWDAGDATLTATFGSSKLVFTDVAISADGNLLATTRPRANGGLVEVWDVRTQSRVAQFTAVDTVRPVFCPTRPVLAWQGAAGQLNFCTFGKTQTQRQMPLAPPADELKALAFAPDGKTLAAVASSGDIAIWALDTLKPQHTFRTGQPWIAELAYSGDGKSMAVLLNETMVNPTDLVEVSVWDVASGRPRGMLDRGMYLDEVMSAASGASLSAARGCLAALPDGHTFALANGELRVWDVRTLASRKNGEMGGQPISLVASGDRGRILATASPDELRLWDATTLSPRQVLWESSAPGWLLLVLLVLGFPAWIILWSIARSRSRQRTCRACGRLYVPVEKLDRGDLCPDCQRRVMSLSEYSMQRAKDWRDWRKAVRTLALLSALVSWGLSMPIDNSIGWRFALYFAVVFGGLATALLTLVVIYVCGQILVQRRRLSREMRDFNRASTMSSDPGEVARCARATAWRAEGTTLVNDLEARIEECRSRLSGVIGPPTGDIAKLTCICFRHRDELLRHVADYNSVVNHDVDTCVVYVPRPWSMISVAEEELRQWLPDPDDSLRSPILAFLLEAYPRRPRMAWATYGLTCCLSHEDRFDELGRLHRRVAAALARGNPPMGAQFIQATGTGIWRAVWRKDDQARFIYWRQFADFSWSLTEYLCGKGATPQRRASFRGLFHDPAGRRQWEAAIQRHLGCASEQLLADWRQWVLDQRSEGHTAPPVHLAKSLWTGSIQTAANEQAPFPKRISAVRQMGAMGYPLGSDVLIRILRDGPERLRSEALWALEAISGQVLGGQVNDWEAWWQDLPDAVKRPAEPDGTALGAVAQ